MGKLPESLTEFLAPCTPPDFFEAVGNRPLHIQPENRCLAFGPAELRAHIQCFPLELPNQKSSVALLRTPEVFPEIFLAAKMNSPVDDWLPGVLSEGWTVSLHWTESGVLPLKLLASELAIALNSRIWINTYYTPAGGRGLALHADNHHVFVWQQTGRKAWKVYAPDSDADAEPLLDFVLEPGEILYIPEGFPHCAQACDDGDSCHLTIGFVDRPTQIREQLLDRFEQWEKSKPLQIGNENGMCGGPAAADIRKAGEQFQTWLTTDLADFEPRAPTPLRPDLSWSRAQQIMRDLRALSAESELEFRSDPGHLRLNPAFSPAVARLQVEQKFTAESLDLPTLTAEHLVRVLVGNGCAVFRNSD